MITKIFFSLIIFPNISTFKIHQINLCKIIEWSFWEIQVYFYHFWKKHLVYFTHKDFNQNNSLFETKNWKITWSNTDFIKIVFDIIKVNEINDFNFFKWKEYYDKIPFWTVLTITSKCNIFCNYCFNDYDYPLKDRNLRKWLWLSDYKNIVDKLYNAWTRDIIITGWEPFSSPFLFDLLEYIKSKWIFIRINTNWTLLFDNILDKLNTNFSLNLMVSLHEFNNKDYYEINKLWAKNIQWIDWLKSFEFKFDKKIEQLKSIKKYRNLSLDFLTILTPKNILYLEKIYEYVLSNFDIVNWHFFRLYSTWTTKWISREMITLAIYKIYKLNKIYNTNFKIVDSVPFCVTKNIDIASKVIDWELSEHHNVKTIITTDWLIQIMSAFDSNLWSVLDNDILEVWNWDFVQKMLNHGFLPEECKDCKYKDDCRWWSRMDWNIYNGSYSAFDPLWDIKNKVVV